MSQSSRKRKEIVLEEEEWIAAIEGIIERDFFPQGTGSADELEEKLRFGLAGAPSFRRHASEISETIVKEGLTLDQFLSRYTSEDNASFRTILDASNARQREKMAHLLPPPPPKDYAKYGNAYKPMNMLMYDGSTRASLPLSAREAPRRLAGPEANIHTVNHKATSMRHIVPPSDEQYHEASKSKQEYSILSTPRFEPGEDATPIMTWGTLDATPQRIEKDDENSRNTGGFSIQQTPQREKLAYTLGKNASAAMDSRKHSRRANMLLTSSSQRVPMSPAARRLASAVLQRKNKDSQLRASYRTPNATKAPPGTSPTWNED